jgi:hypothetical protein
MHHADDRLSSAEYVPELLRHCPSRWIFFDAGNRRMLATGRIDVQWFASTERSNPLDQQARICIMRADRDGKLIEEEHA